METPDPIGAECGCMVQPDPAFSADKLVYCTGGGRYWVVPDPENDPDTRILETCRGSRPYVISVRRVQKFEYTVKPHTGPIPK